MQVLFQIRIDHGGVIGRNIRSLRDRPSEVHEALYLSIYLVTAIGALIWHAVHECNLGADKRGGGAPLRRILRDVT